MYLWQDSQAILYDRQEINSEVLEERTEMILL